jgi:hypothetical protein
LSFYLGNPVAMAAASEQKVSPQLQQFIAEEQAKVE